MILKEEKVAEKKETEKKVSLERPVVNQGLYFLQTYLKGSTVKVKPVDNQYIFVQEDFRNIEVNLNVKCSQTQRETGPVGSIFATPYLRLTDSTIQCWEATYNPDENDPSVKKFWESCDKLLKIGFMDDKGVFTPDPSVDKSIIDEWNKFVAIKDLPLPSSTIGSGAGLSDRILPKLKKEFPCPKIEEDGFYIPEDLWHILLRNIQVKQNTMLVGPTGTGKTEVIDYIATKVGVHHEVTDMGTMHDAIPALLGTHRLVSTGPGETKSIFDYSRFSKIIQQSKTIVTLDELSRAPLSTNNILFPVLDSRRMLPIDIACSDEALNVKVHEDVVFFATANIGSEYTGTSTIDRALIDRFQLVELDYMPESAEIRVLDTRMKKRGTPIYKKELQRIVKFANDMRKMAKEGKVSTGVSTRHTILTTSLVADGFDFKTAIKLSIVPLFEIEERKELMASLGSI